MFRVRPVTVGIAYTEAASVLVYGELYCVEWSGVEWSGGDDTSAPDYLE
jgi:hypothetical protein